MRVFDAKPHLYCNNVSVEPWEQGPSADVVQYRWCRCWTVVVHTLNRADFVVVGCLWCWCFNITEYWTFHRFLDSIYFLRFLLNLLTFPAFELLKLLPTIDTYSELINYPTHPPRFHIPRHFTQSLWSLPETSFLFFWLKFKVLTRQFWPEGSTRNAVGTDWQSLFHFWRTPVFECSGYVDKKIFTFS